MEPESLLHVVAGCKSYLNQGRFTWRHDPVLSIIASTLKSVQNSDLYVDLPGYLSPSVITGDELRPDLLITLENKTIYIVELTVGYETNLLNNATRKRHKYEEQERRDGGLGGGGGSGTPPPNVRFIGTVQFVSKFNGMV